MNYLKFCFYLLFFTITLSCSTDTEDSIVEDNIEKNQSNIKLKVNKNESNILEMLEFNLLYHNDNLTIGTYIADNFDSIVFKTSESDITTIIADVTNSPKIINFKWGHNFYTPGKKIVSLIGYKNNKIVFEDKHHLSITNTKDFLNTNWNDFNVYELYTGYVNLSTTNTITILNSIENKTPTIKLTNTWKDYDIKNIEHESILNEKNAQYLSSYITLLYGNPSYDNENHSTKIESIYLEKFKQPILNNRPIKIWITDKNKIALIETNDLTTKYYILVEQNK